MRFFISPNICNSAIKKQKISEIISLNKLVDNSYEEYMLLHDLMQIIKNVYNSLINDLDDNYKFINMHLKFTFDYLKTIMFNSNDLN